MKYLLLDAFGEIIGDCSHEHSLCERGDLALRNQAVHLRGDGGRFVASGDAHALPFLKHLAKPLRERLCRFADHLTGENVSDSIHHHGSLLVSIVTLQLGEVLKAQAYRHLVASCGGNQIIKSFEVYGRQLVYQHRTFQHSFLIDELDDTRIVQPQCCSVNVLSVGIVPHTKDFRLFGVIDVECEIISHHNPIELRTDHPRQRNLGRGYLSLQLVSRPSEPSVHERRKIVLQFRI